VHSITPGANSGHTPLTRLQDCTAVRRCEKQQGERPPCLHAHLRWGNPVAFTGTALMAPPMWFRYTAECGAAAAGMAATAARIAATPSCKHPRRPQHRHHPDACTAHKATRTPTKGRTAESNGCDGGDGNSDGGRSGDGCWRQSKRAK
jgi:hypothetical protein